MRYGIWALIALVIGAFGAHFLLQDRGYVLISFLGYNVEMSVPVLIMAFVLLYAVVRLLLRIWRAPRQLGEAIASQRLKRSGKRLTRGLIHMTEGDFSRGERLLTDGLAGSDAKVVHYLMAARAAEAQGSTERRDEWLTLARNADPAAETAVLLTQAELQVGNGEHAAALATLGMLEGKSRKHPACLALLADIYLATGDRSALADLMPELAKSGLDPERLARLLARGLELMQGEASFDRERLDAVWSPLPIALRRKPALVTARARLLDRLGRSEEAVKSLVTAMKRGFDSRLTIAYGDIEGPDGMKQLRRVEGWLKLRPDDAVLLMTAAKLCMRNELWGKARSYLESSIAIRPEPATYALYGKLLDGLGEQESAAHAYQAGLRMVAPSVDDLPALAAPAAPDLEEAEG